MGLLVLLGSHSSFAADCRQDIQVSTPWEALSSDRWETGCESVTRTNTSDPYNPIPALAKFYTFTLERDADVRIQLDPQYNSYSRRFALIEGDNEYGNVISQNHYQKLEVRLTAGTYTLEASYLYGSSFTYQVAYNDVSSHNECVQAISSGTAITDGWTSACESTSRDIVDPYNNVPGEGHRTKYFTFSLENSTDIRIEVDATVNSYIYILSGIGEQATPYLEFNLETVTTSLPQGDYTIELTTYERYAPGQFEIEFNAFSNAEGCAQGLVLGSIISGTWSAGCEILSWLDENGDPYQGDGPERANYYDFTLTETKEVRFSLSGQNDSSTVFSLYAAGDYLNKLASTTPSTYWRSPTSEFSIRLSPGSYRLEVTKYNELAIGSYSIASTVYENDECTNEISLGITETAYLTAGCNSEFRALDGINDPYGVQPGVYYAKRFEFTLDEPTPIKVSANTSPNGGYIYLAKRVNGENELLDESWPEDYWRTTGSPTISRTLDAGTYIFEISSSSPEREGQFTARVETTGVDPCATYLNLNERHSDQLGRNTSCHSEFKDPYYNYDPYGSNNGYQYYYAKSFTFEIDVAGTYDIVGSSTSFSSHMFLIQGSNSRGIELNSQSSYGENRISQYLTAGIYTVETTSLNYMRTGSYTVHVWDGANEVIDEPIIDKCNEMLSLSDGSAIRQGTWESDCRSESTSYYYAKTYDFALSDYSTVVMSLGSQTTSTTYLYLYQWNGISWNYMTNGYLRNQTALIQRELTEGLYRLEARTRNTNTHEFSISVGVDFDDDGYIGTDDAFPHDPLEWVDSDGDGIGNHADLDDDDDGFLDIEDDLPLSNSGHLDSDQDGVADALDETPYPLGGDIRFVLKEIKVKENDNYASIVVERIGSPIIDSSIYFYTYDQSASANVDYVPISGKLEFGVNGESQTINVELLDNEYYSGDLSFQVKLAYPSQLVSTSGDLIADVLIMEDDALPLGGIVSISSGTYSVTENENAVHFELIRSAGAIGEAIVFVSTLDDTATASNDYEALSKAVIFTEGEISKSVSVSITDDVNYEGDESFLVQLSSLSEDVVVSGKSAEIRIEENDAIPESGEFTLVVSNMTVKEQQGELVFAIKRTQGALGDARVHWQTRSGSALSDVDFEYDSGELEFNEGDIQKSITIQLLKSEAEFEGLEKSFCIDLTYVSNYSKMDDFCITLLEGDQPPEDGYITFSGASYSAIEGLPVVVTLNRLFVSEEGSIDVLHFNTSSGQAIANQDFSSFSKHIELPKDVNSQEFYIETFEDDLFEGAETFSLLLEENGTTQSASVEILDNEILAPSAGVFRLSGDQYEVQETDGKLSFVIQRLLGSQGQVNLTVLLDDLTAESGVNYDGSVRVISFEHGETSKIVDISIYNDNRALGDKEFSIQLVAEEDTYLLSPNFAIVNIVDAGSDSDNDDILGVALFTPWWLLVLLLPICVVRVKRVK